MNSLSFTFRRHAILSGRWRLSSFGPVQSRGDASKGTCVKLPSLDSLKIVYYPDPVLRERCAPVDNFGPDLTALADRMLNLMRDGNGVGLAAPQVGLPLRLFVCNITGEPEDDMVFVNPQLTDLSGADQREEGCLSLPGVSVVMRRSLNATMNADDTEGHPVEKDGSGLLVRVWQHESDHLDGRMIIDNMSASDEIANRRAIKQLETDFIGPLRGKKSG